MASGGNRRVNQRSVSTRNSENTRYSYIEGNTVRSVQTAPKRQERPVRGNREVSHRARRNHAKALQVNKGYIVFLALVCTATLFACVQFLQLKAVITAQTKEVASLETQLSQLKADNDAFYSETLASVDLDHIREVAINKLGMGYAQEDQIIRYSTKGSSYVRQYRDVPDAK